MIDELKKRKGFIAALDQSGGSSKKTLANYGITDINSDSEMFDYIHKMRTRIITNENFVDKYILGVNLNMDLTTAMTKGFDMIISGIKVEK